MAHRCSYYERIELIDEELVYIVKAVNGDFEMDIAKFYEDGKIEVRENLSFTGMGGYYVIYPGEVDKPKTYKYWSYYKEAFIMPKNPKWLNYENFPNLWLCNYAFIDYDLILDNRPELKYFINKIRKHKIGGRLFMNYLKLI